MICGINTTHDISKFFHISLTQQLVKLRIAISKYHLCYLCQISPQIMLLPILINYNNIFVVLSNFRSSSVADQAMDIIITLSKPKYQEIERGSWRLVLRSIPFSCLVRGLCWHVIPTCFLSLRVGVDAVNDVLRSSLQLLGNAVVKNETTQGLVWKKCFSQFFLWVLLSCGKH